MKPTIPIAVTDDGQVHVGQNQWASLEQIQAAVQAKVKTNPALQANRPSGTDRQQLQIVNVSAALKRSAVSKPQPQTTNCSCETENPSGGTGGLEIAPTPPALAKYYEDEVARKRQFVVNGQEHLPLPTTLARAIEDRKEAPQTNEDSEHLPLPVMKFPNPNRTQVREQPKLAVNIPEGSGGHLIPPSTRRR